MAVASFAVALMAKEDCATLPAVILLFDWTKVRERIAPLTSMIILAAAAGVHTLLATRSIPGSGAGFSAGISAGSYLLNEGYAVLRYLRLLIFPFGFTIDPDIKIGVPTALGAWMLLIVIVGVAIWRKNRWFLAGLLLLLPSSSFIPLADLAADHRMYLPMAAFAGLAGVYLGKIPRAASFPVVIILIALSAARMNVWASDERLWSEAAARAPHKLRPRLQLSRAIEPRQALTELQATQGEFPDAIEIDAELGRVYLQMGQPALALAEYGKVLGKLPRDADALNNRGTALLALGQSEAARQDFTRALKLDPCLASARENLGLPPCH